MYIFLDRKKLLCWKAWTSWCSVTDGERIWKESSFVIAKNVFSSKKNWSVSFMYTILVQVEANCCWCCFHSYQS